jgi:hypothetical protein
MNDRAAPIDVAELDADAAHVADAGSVHRPSAIASFHLIRLKPGRQPVALARLGLDRLRMRRTTDVTFWRLLGTGDGRNTGPGADLRRTALFAIWRDERALDSFMASMATRWASAEEQYHVRLRGVGGHGTWRGVDVLGSIEPVADGYDGPLAIITRADVKLRRWRRFAAAGPAVSEALQQAPGLLAVCGIGEAPIGRQATFSLWSGAAAARNYAYATPEHREVIRRTHAESWYGEEMFARFAPYASVGTWDGIDPLAG